MSIQENVSVVNGQRVNSATDGNGLVGGLQPTAQPSNGKPAGSIVGRGKPAGTKSAKAELDEKLAAHAAAQNDKIANLQSGLADIAALLKAQMLSSSTSAGSAPQVTSPLTVIPAVPPAPSIPPVAAQPVPPSPQTELDLLRRQLADAERRAVDNAALRESVTIAQPLNVSSDRMSAETRIGTAPTISELPLHVGGKNSTRLIPPKPELDADGKPVLDNDGKPRIKRGGTRHLVSGRVVDFLNANMPVNVPVVQLAVVNPDGSTGQRLNLQMGESAAGSSQLGLAGATIWVHIDAQGKRVNGPVKGGATIAYQSQIYMQAKDWQRD